MEDDCAVWDLKWRQYIFITTLLAHGSGTCNIFSRVFSLEIYQLYLLNITQQGFGLPEWVFSFQAQFQLASSVELELR